MNYEGAKLQTLLAGEYVLGLLRGPARRRFERLMMESRTLAAEVAKWEGHFAGLALKLKPVEPPAYLWWRIMARVRSESRPRGERMRNTFWRSWAVAATLVLAIMVVTPRVAPPPEQKPAAIALISDAKGEPWWLVSVHPEAGRIDLKAVMPSPPPLGKSYELWMLPDSGNPRSLGVLNTSGTMSRDIPAELLRRLASAKGLAVSLEPEGGSPTGQPTGPVLMTASPGGRLMSGPGNKPGAGPVSDGMWTHQHRFEMLARAQTPGLYRYAYWLCRDRALAEDLVQETLLRAWRSLDSLREEAAARRWLITILRNEFMRELSKRRDTVAIDDMPLVDPSANVGGSDTDMFDVRRALWKLTPEYREPLALQVLMGCSTQEIADMLELTQGTVLTRLHRARNQLREHLGLTGGAAMGEGAA